MIFLNLDSLDKASNLTKVCEKYDVDFDVLYGRYTIDGKSVLGVASLISPIKCRRRTFLRDYKFLILVSVIFIAFALSGKFVFWQGIVLLGLLLGFIYYNYRNTSRSTVCEGSLSPIANKSWLFVLVVTTVGLSGIILGAELLVKGAVSIARILGVSEEIIGLTVIAIGTSLPELATTVMAAIRRQNGVALGNILGSNIWNIVFIIGFTSVVINVALVIIAGSNKSVASNITQIS